MVKKMNKNNVLMMVIGLFVILTVFSNTDGRQAIPEYDDVQSHYLIEITDYDAEVEVGDLSTIKAKVTNQDQIASRMYVQCSILDRTDHPDWLTDTLLQSIQYLPENDNCVDGEPYTQTGIVELGAAGEATYTFTVSVPDNIGGDNVVYCGAYERCYSDSGTPDDGTDDIDPLTSDEAMIPITIIAADDDAGNNNYNSEGDSCSATTECGGWLLNNIECVNGYCVEGNDVESGTSDWDLGFDFPGLSDIKLKEWMGEHKFILIIVGLVVFLVAFMTVYSTPRQRPQF